MMTLSKFILIFSFWVDELLLEAIARLSGWTSFDACPKTAFDGAIARVCMLIGHFSGKLSDKK
ncbi:MAG: hypothetical protein JSS81_28770 [Acidobacteria bacterium]|nr:hypothetical protein [Acidobacteriota bacterium]